MKIAYARTSTVEQVAGLEAQERDLRALNVDKLFTERISSKAIHRPQLEAAIDYLREGDVLIVTKLDRLARSVEDFVKINRRVMDKGASIQVLALNLDTSTASGKLTMNMFVAIAEFERDLMLERQREGIATAKSEGKFKGRVPTAARQIDKIKELKAAGKSVPEIMAETGVSRASVFRLLKEAAANG